MKIGIITMHKVLNFGSALQAYALQRKLKEMGYESEIIDYDFPPKKRKKSSIRNTIYGIVVFLRALVMGFPQKGKKKRFEAFYDKFYHLSSKKYDVSTIDVDPPKYDVYMSGSDQVWNPRHIGKDANFLLAFAPKGVYKISFASSFATSNINDAYKEMYQKYLSDYVDISVREPSGARLVKELTGREASVCCDPVFLLNKTQWDEIADTSKEKVKGRYILVYALSYMFDPYPELLGIINHVQSQLDCQVVYLNGRMEDFFRRHSVIKKSEGPADFVQLIRNAELVITSSFHGTAFSLIYEKPLIAIVRDNDLEDSRISSLLQRLHAEKSIVPYNKGCMLSRQELYGLKNEGSIMENYIRESENYLRNSLSKVKMHS